MNKLHHTITYYIVVWALLIFFTLTSISLILLQTIWGRQKVKEAFIDYAKMNNITLKMDSIEGLIPFEYKLKNVNILVESQEIDIKKLDCRINIIPLFQNKLTFKSFTADNITIKNLKTENTPKKNLTTRLSGTEPPVSKDIYWFKLPLTTRFKNLKLENLHLQSNNEIITINASGKARVEKDGKTLSADLVITRKNFKDSYVDLTFKGKKENRYITLSAYINVATLKVFDFLIKDSSFDAAFDLNFETSGRLDTYFAYLNEGLNQNSPIQGTGFGKIYKVQIKNKPYDFEYKKAFDYSFDFLSQDNLNINFSNAFLKNDIGNVNLDFALDKNFSLVNATLDANIDDLSKTDAKKISLYGSFNLKANYDINKFNSSYNFQDFRINKTPFLDFSGNIIGQFDKKILTGNISSGFYALEEVFNITSDFKLEKFFINFSNLKIDSASTKLDANLTLTPALALIGNGKMHFEDLKQMQVLFPKLVFYGSSDIDFELKQKVENENSVQNLIIKAISNNYHLKTFFGKSLNINLNIDNPFIKPIMDINVVIGDLEFRDLHFKTINFTTSTKEENWPYTISMAGDLKKPFDIESKGFWKLKKDEFLLNLQDLTGNLFSHNFITPKPIKLEVTPNHFLLTELSLELIESSIFLDIDLTKHSSHAKIKLKHMPLDFLSLNPLDLEISGFASLDLKLDGMGNEINSTCDLDLEEINILSLGDLTPLQANGKLTSALKGNYLNLNGYLNVKESQLLSFKGKIPLDIDIVNLNFKPNTSKAFDLGFKYKGKIEEILDFINIGSQRLEGDLDSEIELTNNLNSLDIKGFCTFKNGYFENYFTGTIIKDIEAKFTTAKDKINLEYLKGQDTDKGTLLAEGVFSISNEKNFPFYFKTQIKDLQCVDSDIFKGIASATIEISGDRLSSIAKGNVIIDQLDMTIPDKLPIIIPDLKPLFIFHPNKNKEIVENEKPKIYPFHLNLDIDATKTPISLNGQGLTSTWQGAFNLGGSYMNFETRGALELIKGQFVFSGRKFTLAKGGVLFSGKVNELPILDIQATMNQQGVDLFANLKGPVDAPKLSFTSKPPLPASSILSLLIFGQPLSDLSASQTLELSYTMSSQVAPSELTKSDSVSSLGIDRFNVVQPSPTDPYGTDQMAVQLGKYISRGLVISYSQGEEQGTSNIVIELDLKKGFIFQAESQQEKEQGKFTLKYRYNY